MAPYQPVLHHTFVIERRFAHPPARVFAAFADPVEQGARGVLDALATELERPGNPG